jgi:hypothetical protein
MKTSEGISVFAAIWCFARWFLERGRDWPSLIITQQDLYSSLSLAQTILALARESNPLLKQFETLIERQVAVFQLPDNLFECFERSFKRPALFLTIIHLNVLVIFALSGAA